MKLKLLLLAGLSVALIIGALRFLPSSEDPQDVATDLIDADADAARVGDEESLAAPSATGETAGARTAAAARDADAAPEEGSRTLAATGAGAPWTIQAIIEWPDGAEPTGDLTVYAHETRVSPVAIQKDLSSDLDLVSFERIENQLFEGLEGPGATQEGVLDDAIKSATVTRRVIDGAETWLAEIQLPASRERAFLHALGGGFGTYKAVEARADDPRVTLRPASRASLKLTAATPDDTTSLEGAYVRLELKGSTAARRRSSQPSMTAYRADRGLDAAGQTVFQGVPSGGELHARFFHETLAPKEVVIPALAEGEQRSTTIGLTAGVQVSGRVVNANGEGLSGATVVAAFPGEAFGLDDESFRSVESGADGEFTLAGLPLGKVIVRASIPGLLDSARIPVVPGTSADTDDLVLVLEEGKSIEGFARFLSGDPAKGLVVRATFDLSHIGGPGALAATRGASNEAVVGDDGSFNIQGLGTGPFCLRVSSEDGGEGSPKVSARLDGVRPGETGVELTLRPRAALRGLCVDDLGNPIEGETLRCARIVPGSLGKVRLDRERATTGLGGAFSFDELAAGTWGITLVSERHVTTEEFVVEFDGVDQSVEVAAVRSCTIQGIVLDPDGQPAGGVRISQSSDDPAWRVGLSGLPTPEPTVSGADGRFVLLGVVPGDVRLGATSDDFAPAMSESMSVEPGGLIEGVTLRMSRGGTIEGVCFNKEGRTASGRLITVQSLSMDEMRTLSSSADGTFRETGLTPGRYQVIAMDTSADLSADVDSGGLTSMLENMEMTIATVEEGETEVVFLGAPPASPVKVTGKIELAGEPRANVTVVWVARAEAAVDTMKVTSTDVDGRYELELDDAGAYSISVSAMKDGGVNQQIAAEFSAQIPLGSEEFVRDIELPGGAITGTVKDADGEPAAGVRLSVVGTGGIRPDLMNGGSYGETRTGADGTYEVVGLTTGSYQVMAGGQSPMSDTPGAASRVISDPIPLGKDQRAENIDLSLTAPGSVKVTVRGSDGQGVSGQVVFLRDDKGRHTELISMTGTNASGEALIQCLAPGRYSAFARSGDQATQESELFEVIANEEAAVELLLEPGVVLVASLKIKNEIEVPRPTHVQVLDRHGFDVSRRIGVADVQYGQAYPLHERRFGPLAPGSYTVIAEGPDGLRGKRRVTLRGGSEKRVTIVLK
jgi:hypothetical protein